MAVKKTVSPDNTVSASDDVRRMFIFNRTVNSGQIDFDTVKNSFSMAQDDEIRNDFDFWAVNLPTTFDRSYGGLRARENPLANTYYGDRLNDQESILPKAALAHAIVTGEYLEAKQPLPAPWTGPLIHAHMTILIGAGTTCREIAHQSCEKTGSVNIVSNNIGLPTVSRNSSVFLLAGNFTRDIWANCGPETIKSLTEYLEDHDIERAFLGCSGITREGKIYVHNVGEADTLTAFAHAAPIITFATIAIKIGKSDAVKWDNLEKLLDDAKKYKGKPSRIEIVTTTIGATKEDEDNLAAFKETLKERALTEKVILLEVPSTRPAGRSKVPKG